MSELSWVKLSLDLFDNRKIKYIRKLPEGNNIMIIWIYLLTLAGKCNSGGMIFLTEDIPLDENMLADLTDFDVNIVRIALATFDKLNMIQWTGDNDEFIKVAGWSEYQSVDRLAEIKEKNCARQKKYREKQKEKAKELPDNGKETLSITSRNVTV